MGAELILHRAMTATMAAATFLREMTIMRRILAATFLLLLSSPAFSESISLSVSEALNAQVALAALDGYDKVVKDDRGQEKAVRVPYVLDGKVRMAIAQDLGALKAILAAFQVARIGKINEIGKGEAIKAGSAEENAAGKAISEMLEIKQNVEGTKFSKEDLGLISAANNQIPPTILLNLGPFFLDGANR